MTENMASVTKTKVNITAATAIAARMSKTATTMVIPKRRHHSKIIFDGTSPQEAKNVNLLPAMTSVRISQMNDDFKFSKENQSFFPRDDCCICAVPGLKIKSFCLQKSPWRENEHVPQKRTLHS
jgi:hypothetical protein